MADVGLAADELHEDASRRGACLQVPVRRHPSASSLEALLQGSDLLDVAWAVESNWALVERDKARAYELIEAASLRYQRLATSPTRPSEELLEIRVMHGKVAEGLYRLLGRIDPVRGASGENRARLASIGRTHRNHAAAAAVAMALRHLAFTDWTESPWDKDGDAGGDGDDDGWRVGGLPSWGLGAGIAMGLVGLGLGRRRRRTGRPPRRLSAPRRIGSLHGA